jgi:RNA polymerase sigma-70 factor (ECF subfamily)
MEDSEAISRFIQSGDLDSFEVLVRRYQDRVFRLAVSILGPGLESEAEEVTQEVFMRAFRRIRSFRMESRFYTWLYRMAYNMALDRRSRARLRLPHLGDDALAREADPKPGSDPFEAAVESRRRAIVAGCLDELPDLYRAVLHQTYWLGYSVEEISDSLGAPPNTVKSYLHRARRRFYALLRLKGLEDSDDLL